MGFLYIVKKIETNFGGVRKWVNKVSVTEDW